MNNAPDKRVPSTDPAYDIIDAAWAGTLWELFCERVRRSPEAIAYREYGGNAQIWRDYSWRTISERVDRLRATLAEESLDAGDRIAVLLPNGVDWVCIDLAAHGSGLVVVGLYPHDTAASNACILGHADARLLVLDSVARWKSLRPFQSQFSALKSVWIADAGSTTAELERASVRKLDEVLASASSPPPPYPATSSDLATVIYTSGTSGRPKGVMLSHFALLWNARSSASFVPPLPNDIFLSILPIAHAFERTVGYYLPMTGGSTVAFGRSAEQLPQDFVAVRPTALLGVPLIFERITAAVRANVAASPIKRALLALTVAAGWRRFLAIQQQRAPGLATRMFWAILQRTVARPVLATFGGRLRIAVSGGAPLPQDVAKMLIGLGLPVVEGYGLTEAAPVVAANRLEDNLPGSVGRPLIGVEVKVSSDGELLVRSPSMMMGYWKDPALTARSLDSAGWLATGDVAEIKDGRVFIRGRLADIIVLSIGEKINPNIIEAQLARDPLFKQTILVGDRRPYPVAVVVLEPDVWRIFAAEKGLDPQQPNHPAAKLQIMARISPLLAALPRFAQVRAVHLTLDPWTIEAGLVTPTLKAKRDQIAPLFATEIDGLYAED